MSQKAVISFSENCLADLSSARHTCLLAVGIQMDQQLQDQAAGNLQGPEEVARGRVYPCLPSEGLPSKSTAGLPPGVTVGESCRATADLGASAAGPSPEEGMLGKAAGLQSSLEEAGCGWDLGLHDEGTQPGEDIVSSTETLQMSQSQTYHSCPSS